VYIKFLFAIWQVIADQTTEGSKRMLNKIQLRKAKENAMFIPTLKVKSAALKNSSQLRT